MDPASKTDTGFINDDGKIQNEEEFNKQLKNYDKKYCDLIAKNSRNYTTDINY